VKLARISAKGLVESMTMSQVVVYLFLTYVNVINKLLLWERNAAQKNETPKFIQNNEQHGGQMMFF
jgi:hypothetical protein